MINLEKALVGTFSVIVKPMDRLQHPGIVRGSLDVEPLN